MPSKDKVLTRGNWYHSFICTGGGSFYFLNSTTLTSVKHDPHSGDVDLI